MQPTSYTPTMRQRPLQKSMFLPQTQYIPRNNSMQYQYQDMMKRSSIQQDNNNGINKVNSMSNISNFQFSQSPQTPIQHQYNLANNNVNNNINNNNLVQNNHNQILSFSHNTRYKQTRASGQFEQLPSVLQVQGNQLTLQQVQEKLLQLTQLVESHQQVIKRHQLNNLKDKPLAQALVEQIQQRLKQSYIPSIVSKQTKEIYQHIFNFKIQIAALKQEILGVGETVRSELSNVGVNVNNANNTNSKISTSVNSSEKLDKAEEETFAELKANFMQMQTKLSQVQKSLQGKNDDLKAFILTQIQKTKPTQQQQQSPSKLKPSTIQSTLSPIMLEYKELFVIKHPSTPNRHNMSSPRSKEEIRLKEKEQTEIIINSTTYFIDKEGFLLDSQNRYIVDAKGAQIRLEEKHLTLLKNHNVLG